MNKVLVTGAAGFVGSTLVDKILATTKLRCVGVDSFTDYYSIAQKRRNLEGALGDDRFELLEQDLLAADLDNLLEGVDVVFHLAGQPGVRPSWGASFKTYTDQNVLASQRLLEAVRASDRRIRVVYASSSSIYGSAERYPVLESDLPRPLSPYGVSKLAAEHLMRLYAENFGIHTVSLRYFTVYGPRQRPDMGFTRFIAQAFTNQPITIFGSGEQVRDFTYVDDIVDATIGAGFSSGTHPGDVFNIAGGSSVTLKEALLVLEQAVDRKLSLTFGPDVPGDVRRTGGDASLARRVLPWAPKFDLTEGIRNQVTWWQSNSDH